MLFLVELDHGRSGAPLSPDSARTFMEQIIFPTIARAEQLVDEQKIVSGGALVGRVALRLMVEAGSAGEVDQLITSLPLWPLAETRITPLISFGERRQHVENLLESARARA